MSIRKLTFVTVEPVVKNSLGLSPSEVIAIEQHLRKKIATRDACEAIRKQDFNLLPCVMVLETLAHCLR